MRIFQPTVTGSNTTTGSLHISGPVYFYTLETSSVSHTLVYNTSSGQVFYTASEAIGRKPGEPNQSIQFNGGGEFSGSANLTYVNNIVYLTGSSLTSGSITLTGSMFVSGAISASFGENTVGFYGTASWAQSASQATSASYAATASAAPSDTYIQYNKSGILGAEQYFRYIYNSHSLQQGNQVTALGEYSYAQGSSSVALGIASHTEGYNTIASGSFQTVVGQYNVANTSQSAFIIGDGNISPISDSGIVQIGGKAPLSSVQIPQNLDPLFLSSLIGGTITLSEGVNTGTFTITNAFSAGGYYTIAFTPNCNFNITPLTATYSLNSNAIIRHNLLFASRSWFDVSASSVFLRGIPTSSELNILVYNSSSGQVYYTSSFGGGSGTPASPTNSIQFNGDGAFSGSSNLTYLSGSSELYLTGSMFVSGAISASLGPNTVGFYGTASWAQSASQAISASFASTAAAAPEDTYIQYNKDGLFGAEQYFRYIYDSHSLQHGFNSTAFGYYSHAQGSSSLAHGTASHAEGWRNTASGNYSHAEGESNKVFGNGSHVEGRLNYISESSRWSHVGGLQNSASGWYQTIIGQNNKPILSQSAFIIGGDSYSSPPLVRWNMFVAIPKTDTIDPASSATPSDSIIEMRADTASISASYLYLNNLPTSPELNVLVYNSSSGQVFYTSSTAVGGGSGIPAPPTNSIQFNSASAFGGSAALTFISASSTIILTGSLITSGSTQTIGTASFTGSVLITGSTILTGSMFVSGAISASFGPNTVGFYGTSSWAIQAITSSYPIDVTGSSLYSVAPAAGVPNIPEDNNSIFFGYQAGFQTDLASNSNFLGYQVGYSANTASNSNFLGYQAGYLSDFVTQSNFLGYQAGYQVDNAYNSNFLGYRAGRLVKDAYNSNFIGYEAGSQQSSINTSSHNSNFIGYQVGKNTNNVYNSNFIGYNAGTNADFSPYSNFLGHQAGNGSTSASYSNFIGYSAGSNSDLSSRSIFIGYEAGSSAPTSSNSTFIGYRAGYIARNSNNSIFIGYEAGREVFNSSHSIFIGYQAGKEFDTGGVDYVGPNNIIIGTNVTLPISSQDSINIGGLIFATGSNSNVVPTTPTATPAGGKVGINIYPPLFNFHASGTISFPSLTSSSQVNVVVVDTASGQLFYTASSAVGGGTFNSTSSIIGNGLSSSYNINHGFNTRNLHITVYESSSNGVTGNGETVYPDIRRINENTASIIFANPPSSSQYIVYISQ